MPAKIFASPPPDRTRKKVQATTLLEMKCRLPPQPMTIKTFRSNKQSTRLFPCRIMLLPAMEQYKLSVFSYFHVVPCTIRIPDGSDSTKDVTKLPKIYRFHKNLHQRVKNGDDGCSPFVIDATRFGVTGARDSFLFYSSSIKIASQGWDSTYLPLDCARSVVLLCLRSEIFSVLLQTN